MLTAGGMLRAPGFPFQVLGAPAKAFRSLDTRFTREFGLASMRRAPQMSHRVDATDADASAGKGRDPRLARLCVILFVVNGLSRLLSMFKLPLLCR